MYLNTAEQILFVFAEASSTLSDVSLKAYKLFFKLSFKTNTEMNMCALKFIINKVWSRSGVRESADPQMSWTNSCHGSLCLGGRPVDPLKMETLNL